MEFPVIWGAAQARRHDVRAETAGFERQTVTGVRAQIQPLVSIIHAPCVSNSAETNPAPSSSYLLYFASMGAKGKGLGNKNVSGHHVLDEYVDSKCLYGSKEGRAIISIR